MPDDEYIHDLEVRIAALLRPIDTYACSACGRADGLDAAATPELWDQLSDGQPHIVLCLWCMDQRAAERGLTGSLSLAFFGRALRGHSESDTDRDFIQRLATERDARTTALEQSREAMQFEVDRRTIPAPEFYATWGPPPAGDSGSSDESLRRLMCSLATIEAALEGVPEATAPAPPDAGRAAPRRPATPPQ